MVAEAPASTETENFRRSPPAMPPDVVRKIASGGSPASALGNITRQGAR